MLWCGVVWCGVEGWSGGVERRVGVLGRRGGAAVQAKPLSAYHGCVSSRGQYSSFCVCAGVILLGGSDHMEDGQDKGSEEIRESVEALAREEEVKTRDDMWMSALVCRHVVRHLEPCGACERINVREKCAV